jgi:OOP family OmpA-OmpF porin
MVRLIVLFVISFLGLVQVSFAVEPLSEGFYLGGSLGVSELDDDDFFDDDNYGLDDNDVVFGVFGGYKFNPYFALEGRYTNFGGFEIEDRPSGYSDEDVDIDALSVHAVGIYPFGSSGWSIYGQAGLGSVSADTSSGSSETALSFGVGVSYNTTENWSFALQGDVYAWEDDDASFSDDDYDFDVTTIQLAVRYTF